VVFWSNATRTARWQKKGHSEEQILCALHQAESGTRVADICRQHGISEATYYIWKKKYSGLGLSDLRELRQMCEENAKLKRPVADLSLDRHILQEIVQKALKPRQRRELGHWTQTVFALSSRAAGLMVLDRVDVVLQEPRWKNVK
jgi:putative transposase